MMRVITIVAVSSSLLIVPVLCLSGVVMHTCDCTTATVCNMGADCGHEYGCGHESSCADDPCSFCVVRIERQGDDVVSVSPSTIILSAVTQASIQTARAGVHEWIGGRYLPFPSSDLPLLI